MPIEAIMSRIGEIRSIVGIDPMSAPEADTVNTVAADSSSKSTIELSTAFADELSTAVSNGDTAQMTALLNGATSSAPAPKEEAPAIVDANLPAGAAAVARGEIAATSGAGRDEPAVAPVEKAEKTSTPAKGSAAGNDVVTEAKKYLGVPYVWGGTNPVKGLDCSGLVQLVFKNLGYDLPRVARQQAKVGTQISSLSQAEPGDLLGMRNGSHIAIYLGNNKILHAPRPGQDVSIRELTKYDDIDTIRRVAKDDSPSTAKVASAAVSQSRSALAGA